MMELTEIVSPHVALPVVGVLVCALLVFAFGFKSPGQPPSFDFDDKKKSRRAKQKSGRSHTGNGHVPVSVEDVSSKTSTGGKSPRSTASSTASNKNASPTSTKTSPSSKQDSKKVVKRAPASKIVEDTKTKKESPPDIDEEGWMTQVSKKGKKQRGKKDDLEVVDKQQVKEDVTETQAPETTEAQVTPAETGSPPLEKRKKKSRKTSKGTPDEVSPIGGSGEPAKAPVEEQTKENVTAAGEPEPELVPEAEIQPEIPEEQAEEVMEESAPEPPKKVKQKKKEIGADFELPDIYTKPPVIEPAQPAVTKPAKSPKKNKKDKKQVSKAAVELVADTLDTDLNTATATAESAISEAMEDIPAVREASPVENPAQPIPAVPEVSPVESTTQPAPSSSAQSTENVTFDELGDSWIEAKVKTKKKKARREN